MLALRGSYLLFSELPLDAASDGRSQPVVASASYGLLALLACFAWLLCLLALLACVASPPPPERYFCILCGLRKKLVAFPKGFHPARVLSGSDPGS